MSEWMIFADRLKKEMERQGLSYRRLADKVRITTTTLFRYAKGKRVPRANEILKIADALGVTCDYLLGLTDEPPTTAAQPTLRSTCDQLATDTINRQAAIDAVLSACKDVAATECAVRELEELPSAQPEIKPIGYNDCSNAMMKMWMDNVVTDGEYNRIMDKLNAYWRSKDE